MKKTTLVALLLCFFMTFSYSQNRISVMFYNLLNYPNINPTAREDDLRVILNTYTPDIFAVCELNNVSGANSILSELQTIDSNYQMATFVTNSSDDMNGNSNSLQQTIFFNSSKVLLDTQHTPLQTTLRDINHYTFLVNSVDQGTNPVYFDFYVSHLKASQGASEEAERAAMVNVFTADLANLPTDRPVIFAGDLNMYRDTEAANIELLDNTNPIVLIDPVNRQGSWHNNSSFLDVFTQSTSTSGVNGGAGGGFDDRFDFIYLSQNFLSNSNLLYSINSYRAIGNNDNNSCFNQSINSTNCSGATYSSALRNALFNFSDHLPVYLELQTDQVLSTPDFVNSDEILKLVNGNIVSNQLTIQLSNTNLLKPKLLLLNTLGQTIKRVDLNNDAVNSVNIDNLSSGMYYIKLENSNIEALKFIKR